MKCVGRMPINNFERLVQCTSRAVVVVGAAEKPFCMECAKIALFLNPKSLCRAVSADAR